jgi:hypothetical protein
MRAFTRGPVCAIEIKESNHSSCGTLCQYMDTSDPDVYCQLFGEYLEKTDNEDGWIRTLDCVKNQIKTML